ncbi:hypothetical protein, partial [Nocardioides stalactiti]|uniref:hypothetical protein n=1 Tax=Nocardioides stalactiti TaxID=2755356 RepID=UPI001C7E5A5E
MTSTTADARAPRRALMLASVLLLIAPATAVVVGTAVAPPAQAATTVLVPPELDWSPPLTGGPARRACGSTVHCVGASGSFATIQAGVRAA